METLEISPELMLQLRKWAEYLGVSIEEMLMQRYRKEPLENGR